MCHQARNQNTNWQEAGETLKILQIRCNVGVHWLDGASQELHGATFTKTFIWGSYDGEFVFWEPMVTRDYLLTHPQGLIVLPQPAAYKRDGWYPTRYEISYSAIGNEYSIALRDLQFHQGQ